MSTTQSMTVTALPEHRSPVPPTATVVNASNESLWAELEYRNAHLGTHAEALQRHYEKYAVKFTVDAPRAEPTDADIARVLANCGRPPKPAEYPAIRRYVQLWREARVSGRSSVKEQIQDRAESYWNDACKFANMLRLGQTSDALTEEDCKTYAVMYRTISDELRKVADSL